ncbi:MAG: hypothetical protein ACRDMV_18275 [Streptosporangiales bacterium]
MRKPTQARLLMLTMIQDGRVRRTVAGWVVCSQRATAADKRQLTAIREAGWLALSRDPAAEWESVPVRLTEAARDVLIRYSVEAA